MKDVVAPPVRADKWLWAARFFKTRALASEAIQGGRVHLNGVRIKPSRHLSVGDELKISRGTEHFVVIVAGLSDRRGPAVVAQTLFEETQESLAKREQLKEQRRFLADSMPHPDHRPDKKQRRQLRRMKS